MTQKQVKRLSAITAASFVLGLGLYATATPKEPPVNPSVVSVYGDAVPLADVQLSDGVLQATTLVNDSGTTERVLPTRERQTPVVEREVPTRERQVPVLEREIPTVERTTPIVEREVPTRERQVPDIVREMPTRERQVPDIEREVPTRERQAPDIEREMPTRENLLPEGLDIASNSEPTTPPMDPAKLAKYLQTQANQPIIEDTVIMADEAEEIVDTADTEEVAQSEEVEESESPKKLPIVPPNVKPPVTDSDEPDIEEVIEPSDAQEDATDDAVTLTPAQKKALAERATQREAENATDTDKPVMEEVVEIADVEEKTEAEEPDATEPVVKTPTAPVRIKDTPSKTEDTDTGTDLDGMAGEVPAQS